MKVNAKVYHVHMEACRLMVLAQGKIDKKEIAEKISINTTLQELAEISVTLGFHWGINRI